MPKKDKALQRLISVPSDYTYNELTTLLGQFGYQERSGGATGGSRRRFVRESDQSIIMLHKPHPGNIVGKATIRDVIQHLKEHGDIEE